MSGLAPALDTALSQDRAIVTLLIDVDLPTHGMRLLVGGATIAWNGVDYSDEDTVFGTLAAIDAIEDGEGDQAPGLGITMFPPGESSAAMLSSPSFQGSAVRVWLAGISPVTGLVIPDPYLLFSGQVDQPILKIGANSRTVDLENVSQFDRLLEDDEGARLSDAFQQSIWPGETGFANVTGLEHDIYWGLATPSAATQAAPVSSTGRIYAGQLR